MKVTFTLLLCFALSHSIAQKLYIKNYQLSYSTLEREPFGNNPLTIAPLIKDKGAYNNSIGSFPFSGIAGSPDPETIKVIQFAIELSKKNTTSFFWKKFSFKAGIGVSWQIAKNNMSLSNADIVALDSVSTISYKTYYKIEHASRQANLVLGLLYRTKIFKHVNFTTGLVFQPNITVSSRFQRSTTFDTLYLPAGIKKSVATTLPTLKGNTIYTYNLYIPLGFEINAYKEEWFVRAVLNAGFLHSKYYLSASKMSECNGLEFGIIYQPWRK